MSASFSQRDRQGRLTTTLGDSDLVLLRMDGTEEMSGDFTWRVEALSDQSGLDLEALLGTHATVEIDHAQGIRAFDGIVVEAVHRGPHENGWRYDLVLRPWLHVAGLRRNMRIFHNKTAVQIIEEVLVAYAGLGKPHLDVQTTGDYPVLEYTVQYGETDADFVRRQMERHGITWSWKHEAGSHTLLLTDAVFSLPKVTGGSRPYYGVEGYNHQEEEHFKVWSSARRITTGAVRLTEYNFKTPNAAQEVDRTGDATHPSGDVESYDWPGDYLDQGEGGGVVARRIDAERGQAPRHRAEGDVVSLGAGWRVTLGGDDVPGATGQTFVCLKAEHHFRSQAYGSGGSDSEETPYEGSYVLLPEDTPFRPERRLAGPKVQGPETAVVVGEGEIDCDEHGRILVRFHWDLEAAHSMRVRVSQNWASKGWGGMVIPRIGMEVIVEHLRGDPDKPIVTGCVYNGKNTPPYELPANKTKSVFRSDTHKGSGFNEFTFEDENGQELIYMHGQKDHQIDILNDRDKTVGRDQSESVGRDKQIGIGRDHTENIGRDAVHIVGNDQSLTIGNDRQEHIDGNKAVFIGGQGSLLFGALSGLMTAGSGFMKKHGTAAGAPVGGFAGAVGSMAGAASGLAGLLGKAIPGSGTLNTVIEKFRSDTIGIARTEQIGMFKNTVVGHSQSVSVGKKVSVVVGEDYDIEAKKTIFTRTKKHTQMATEKVVIGGPGGTIIIDSGGVTIKAKSIKLKSPSIDMSSGSPDAVQLQSDKPYNQKCE